MSIQLDQDTPDAPDDAPGGLRRVRVAIVGAGFSGLGLAIRLKRQGMDDFVILERASEVGGTWRDNTYPGCACDVPSHLYSFSFAPNPNWTRTYSPQGEIQAYLRHCAERFGIGPHIQWDEEVRDAAWDEASQRWRITTTHQQFLAETLALGNGPLSEPTTPNIPGIASFQGRLFHSARWDHDYDLTGKRVAVIGTGASAIQFVPHIQPQVAQLTLFQRTPPWIIPRLDRPIPPWRRRMFRWAPITQRLTRTVIYWQREINVLGLVYRPTIIQNSEKLVLNHLAAHVADPVLRAKLTPTYRMGCKRILLSDDFYPAVSQPNVAVVTDPIREVRAGSVVTNDGSEFAVDAIICATGFHVTDMPAADYVRGRDGRTLAEAWRDAPSAYLGTTVAGFPNLFILIGPNTGLGLTSMVFMMESQFNYILDALRCMRRVGAQSIEAQPTRQRAFNDEVQRRMVGTVWASGCSSWYLGANGYNSTIWPGFTWEYRQRTRHFDPAAYTLAAPTVEPGQRNPSALVSGREKTLTPISRVSGLLPAFILAILSTALVVGAWRLLAALLNGSRDTEEA